MFNIIETL